VQRDAEDRLHPMAVVPALATAETGHYEDENEHP